MPMYWGWPVRRLSPSFYSTHYHLLIGFVAEVAHLLYIPDSRWYETRLARRFDTEILARRKALQSELFPTLPTAMQAQFQRLEKGREALISVVVKAQPSVAGPIYPPDRLSAGDLAATLRKQAKFPPQLFGSGKAWIQRSSRFPISRSESVCSFIMRTRRRR